LLISGFVDGDVLTFAEGCAGVMEAPLTWYTSFTKVTNGTVGHAALPVGSGLPMPRFGWFTRV